MGIQFCTCSYITVNFYDGCIISLIGLTLATSKVSPDTENRTPIEPEEAIHTSISSIIDATTGMTLAPTMEGPASTLKKLKESQNKSLSKQLDKQTTQINKKVAEILLQPLQKHIKYIDKQSQLIRQLQLQIKQLQKQISQIQSAVSTGKKKNKR